MILLERRALGSAAKILLLDVPPIVPKVGGAEKRLRRAAASCWREAVAVAMDSEVRMRLSVVSK